MAEDAKGGINLTSLGNGIWTAPGARIIDRTGRKILPIGRDGFEMAAADSVLVDKTMLIADVLDSGYAATLFCRPRRFGKTLNMTMMKAFFEIPIDGHSRAPLFEGTEVWEAGGGRYRENLGIYPVIHLSFRTAKGNTWGQTYNAIKNIVTAEYVRHAFLMDSDRLTDTEKTRFASILDGSASEGELADSLLFLSRCLKTHYGQNVVVLIDEYDAPVMAAYSAPDGGYYGDAVTFLKGWLTGTLKDGGEVLAFACLTGVQRISKESIFSDLNNLTVNTALSTEFEERYGFTDDEVAALASYLGLQDCMPIARHWYDGYRFGGVDVYNPWSVLNFFKLDCAPDVYWGNTSSNSVVGDLIRHADVEMLEKIYALLEPGGVVEAPLDLGVVFPDIGIRQDALWSMLYLAGYLTTEDTALPNNTRVRRRLRVPNAEVAELYRTEVVERFSQAAGSSSRLDALHEALASGNRERLLPELERVVRDSASYLDITSENAAHMLVLGLCFSMPGYGDPLSNREEGFGRPDIQLRPAQTLFFSGKRPLLTIELKYAEGASPEELEEKAHEALRQIAENGYDTAPLPDDAFGRMRWGVAFSGKHIAAVSEKVE